MIRAEVLAERVAYHAEGPVWWPDAGLRFCDGYAGDLVSLDSESGRVTQRLHVADYLGAFRPRLAGGVVAGVDRGFLIVDADDSIRTFPPVWTDAGLRMNEGACDWSGTFYCGRLKEDDLTTGHGALYAFAGPGRPVVTMVSGVGISNGLVFDRAQGLAYYVDTLTRSIQCFDHVPGEPWGKPRVAVDLTDRESYPDGLTMDADGNLWVALWGEGAVHCYSPGSSRTLERVETPGAAHTTAMAFGGPDLRSLFITASQQGENAGPLAGSVFVARPGATGVLPYPCTF